MSWRARTRKSLKRIRQPASDSQYPAGSVALQAADAEARKPRRETEARNRARKQTDQKTDQWGNQPTNEEPARFAKVNFVGQFPGSVTQFGKWLCDRSCRRLGESRWGPHFRGIPGSRPSRTKFLRKSFRLNTVPATQVCNQVTTQVTAQVTTQRAV